MDADGCHCILPEQKAAQEGFIKMTTRWAKLFNWGRHSDWNTRSRNAPWWLVLFPLSASSSPKATGPFCKAFFPSQVSRSVCIWNHMDEQNLFIWELDVTQSLPVNSAFVASPAELPQEISASRVPVSWTTQEGYLEALNCCSEVSNQQHLGSKGEPWRIIFKKILDLNISKPSHFHIVECFSLQSTSYWILYWWDQYVWIQSLPMWWWTYDSDWKLTLFFMNKEVPGSGNHFLLKEHVVLNNPQLL